MTNTFSNLVSVLGGEMAIRIANLAAAVVIARLYGPTNFGLYATALAFATIVVLIGDNGLSISTVSETSRRIDEIDRVVSSVYVTKTVLFTIAVAVAATVTSCWHLGTAAWLIGALVLAKVLLNSYGALNFGVLKSLGQMHVIGILQSLHASGLLCGIAVVYARHLTIETLLLVLLGGQLIESITSGVLVYSKGVRPVPVLLSDCWRLVAFSTPIGGACILSGVILRMDVLAISVFYSAAHVGHFAAANTGLVVIYVVGNLFGNVLLPEMVTMPRVNLPTYIARWRCLIFAAAIPIALGVAVIARSLIVLAYGQSYADAGILASIMVLATPFIIVNYLYFNRAIALQQHRCYLTVYLSTAVLTVVLDLALAYSFGSTGVAIAIVAREAFMFIMYTFSAGQRAIIRTTESSPASVSIGE